MELECMLIFSRSLRCIQVIAGVLGRAGQKGQQKRLEAAKTGEVTWLPPPGLGRPITEEEKLKQEAESGERVLKPKVEAEDDEPKMAAETDGMLLDVIKKRQGFKSRDEDDDV